MKEQMEQVKQLKQQFDQLQKERQYDMLFMAFVAFELDIEVTEENFDYLSNMYSIFMIEDQYTRMLSERLVKLGKEVGL